MTRTLPDPASENVVVEREFHTHGIRRPSPHHNRALHVCVAELQRALYGRGGVVTEDQLQELATFQETAAPAPTSGSSERPVAAEEPLKEAFAVEPSPGSGFDLASDVPKLAVGSSRKRRWMLGAAGVSLLGVGLGVGMGLGMSAARTPVAHAVPPSVGMLDPESVVYFGEVEQSRVWSALDLEGNRCVIASFVSGDGGNVTCEPNDSQVTVSVPDEETNTTVRYVMSFADDDQIPSLTVSRHEDRTVLRF